MTVGAYFHLNLFLPFCSIVNLCKDRLLLDWLLDYFRNGWLLHTLDGTIVGWLKTYAVDLDLR